MSKHPRTDDGNFADLSPGLVKRLVSWVEAAGSPTEADSQRNGFLSYKSESHAAGMGIAAGWYYGAEGGTQLLSLVWAAAVYGKSHEANAGQRRRLFKDIAHEPHYALAGVVIGAVLGTATSAGLDLAGVDVTQLASTLTTVVILAI